MTRTLRIAVLALAGATLLTADATAQRRGLVDVTPPHHRRGFWVEGGLGWGTETYKPYVEVDPETGEEFLVDDWEEKLGKPSMHISLGGTLSPMVRLGAEWTYWWNNYQDDEGNDLTEYLHHVGATARIYPVRSLGLFAKAGAGLGVVGSSLEYGDGTSETGFSYDVGAGYEIKVSRTLYVTPMVEWIGSSYQQRKNYTLYERLFNLSLNVTFQPGR